MPFAFSLPQRSHVTPPQPPIDFSPFAGDLMCAATSANQFPAPPPCLALHNRHSVGSLVLSTT